MWYLVFYSGEMKYWLERLIGLVANSRICTTCFQRQRGYRIRWSLAASILTKIALSIQAVSTINNTVKDWIIFNAKQLTTIIRHTSRRAFTELQKLLPAAAWGSPTLRRCSSRPSDERPLVTAHFLWLHRGYGTSCLLLSELLCLCRFFGEISRRCYFHCH